MYYSLPSHQHTYSSNQQIRRVFLCPKWPSESLKSIPTVIFDYVCVWFSQVQQDCTLSKFLENVCRHLEGKFDWMGVISNDEIKRGVKPNYNSTWWRRRDENGKLSPRGNPAVYRCHFLWQPTFLWPHRAVGSRGYIRSKNNQMWKLAPV
jgi:hypothetical protein